MENKPIKLYIYIPASIVYKKQKAETVLSAVIIYIYIYIIYIYIYIYIYTQLQTVLFSGLLGLIIVPSSASANEGLEVELDIYIYIYIYIDASLNVRIYIYRHELLFAELLSECSIANYSIAQKMWNKSAVNLTLSFYCCII